MTNQEKQAVREHTLDDLREKLQHFNRCALIRPPGFGKTFMLTSLISQYESVLYLYPAKVIANTVIDRYICENDMDEETAETIDAFSAIPNATLMTYSKLIRLSEEDIENMDYDLVIMDECHLIGAIKTNINISLLFETHPDTHFIGATATPVRSDSFDVIGKYFNQITVEPFTIHDAFKTGFYVPINYCFCSYDIDTDLKNAALTAGQDINNLRVKEILQKRLIEISKIYNMSNIIKQVITETDTDDEYMKFIVFFSNFTHMAEHKDDVIRWFTDAYPDHTVKSMEISSRKADVHKNVDKLDSLVATPDTIDLILCVDMLNMGYHVDNMTGIVMYRCTVSNIIYTQQLGRCFNSGTDKSPIIFDVVDNLHRKSVFDLQRKQRIGLPPKKTKMRIINGKVCEKLNGTWMPRNDLTVAPDRIHILNKNGYPTRYIISKIDTVWEQPDKKQRSSFIDVSRIEPEDLVACGNIASYRELMAKIMAEPMVQRCRQVAENHLQHWCDAHAVPYPITDTELKEMYDLNKADYWNAFKDLICQNKIGYPIDDVINMIQNRFDIIEDDTAVYGGQFVNISYFMKASNVGIEDMLDLLVSD